MCTTCNEEQSRRYHEKLEQVKAEGRNAGKAKGVEKVYIVRTVNGQPGWRLEGDESLTRLETIDLLYIF